jgi:hypothetical protein
MNEKIAGVFASELRQVFEQQRLSVVGLRLQRFQGGVFTSFRIACSVVSFRFLLRSLLFILAEGLLFLLCQRTIFTEDLKQPTGLLNRILTSQHEITLMAFIVILLGVCVSQLKGYGAVFNFKAVSFELLAGFDVILVFVRPME